MPTTHTNDERNSIIEDAYNQYYKIVYCFCMGKINYQPRYNSLVEDCVQDAFILYALSFDSLKNHPNPAGWLCQAAWNKLRTKIRNNKSRIKKLEEVARLQDSSPAQLENTIDQWMDREENQYKLAEICALLTDMERNVCQHHFVEELSLSETARKTGLSQNSVRSATDRIRKRAKGFNNLFALFLVLECIFRFSRTK